MRLSQIRVLANDRLWDKTWNLLNTLHVKVFLYFQSQSEHDYSIVLHSKSLGFLRLKKQYIFSIQCLEN